MNVTGIAKSTPPPGPLPDESGRGSAFAEHEIFSPNALILAHYLPISSSSHPSLLIRDARHRDGESGPGMG